MSTATVPASTAGVQAIYTKHIFPRRSEAAQRRMEGHVLALLTEFGYPPLRLKQAVQWLAQTRVGRWRWPAEVVLAACRGANMTSVLARKSAARDAV